MDVFFNRQSALPIGTNCALLADLFLYSYEADFIQGLLKKNEKKLARFFNITFRYIDDVIPLNNSRLGDIVDRIYPIELEIKDITDTNRSASYLDLHIEIDSECRLRTKPYDKTDDFNLPIVNFPFIYSNIPAAPAYGVYISKWIRYSDLISKETLKKPKEQLRMDNPETLVTLVTLDTGR